MMKAMKRRGRPPKADQDKRADRLDLRVSAVEKQAFKLAAESDALDLSVWVRIQLHRAASSELAQLGADRINTNEGANVEPNKANTDRTSVV